MTDIPIGDMIAKYVEIKDFVEAEDAAYAERMKPYKDAMTTLQTNCGVVLQATNQQNAKGADGGTAYLQHGLSVKVDNRQVFLDFVTSNNAWDFLDAGVLKDPVRDYLDKNQADPPGVKSTPYVKCLIRR